MIFIASDKYAIKGVAESKQGGRKENQDDMGFIETPLGFLMVVCDGMGGGPGGKTASHLALQVFMHYLLNCNEQSPRQEALKQAIGKANEALYTKMAEEPSLQGMGTTLVAILLNEQSALIAHLGDSRCYQLNERKLKFRTTDHSLVAELVKTKALTEEQARVPHYFVATRELNEDYNAGQYERDALALIDRLFATHDVLVMTGGSMLYADAVCKGLDDLPSVPAQIRKQVQHHYEEQGLTWLQHEVQRLDPDYWNEVDQNNPARLAHCVELSLTTGKPYSSLRSGEWRVESGKKRPFRIIKIGLERPRAELYARINERVHEMMRQGLEQEARSVYPLRRLTSLQTVGYRELFAYMDGEYDLPRAIELIQQNTRHYAKRQMTWFRKDKDIHWLNANDTYEKNCTIIDALLRADSLQKE